MACVAVVVVGCGRGGAPTETAKTPTQPRPVDEVVPALATSMHPVSEETVSPTVFETNEQMAQDAKVLDERAAKLGQVVSNVDELVASALDLQRSLLLIYAEEKEEQLNEGEGVAGEEEEAPAEAEPEPQDNPVDDEETEDEPNLF